MRPERRALRRLGAVVAAGLLAGLLAGGCSVLAPKADYADYRAVRLARPGPERAEARRRYLDRHGDGAWVGEVRAEHEAAEARLFEQGRDDPAVLAAYLRAYPRGRFVSQARDRLAALRTLRRQRAEERARIEARRRELVEARRRWARRALGFWLRTLLAIERWGEPLPEVVRAHPEFDRAFGRPPRPRCVRSECVKFYRIDFAVPMPGGTRIERRLDVVLRLRVEQGRLVGADLLMPGRGFSRWYELERREPIDDLDGERRGEALTWALEGLAEVLREARPEAKPVDLVPEPLPPLRIPLPEVAEQGAELLPDAEGGAGAEQGPAPAPVPPQVEGGAPGDDQEAASLSLPVALGAWRVGATTVVVFAASPDETGAAYDGVSILWTAASDDEAQAGSQSAPGGTGP